MNFSLSYAKLKFIKTFWRGLISRQRNKKKAVTMAAREAVAKSNPTLNEHKLKDFNKLKYNLI